MAVVGLSPSESTHPWCFAMQAEKGWSVGALQASAEQLGLSRAASGMVPNGAADLVEVCVFQASVLFAAGSALHLTR